MDRIPIYKPYLNSENLKYAHEALDSTWISSQGKYVEMVQEFLKDMLGVKHVLLTNSGTSAMHLVARVIHRLFPEKRNVITGNNHYVAAWNAWEYENHFNLAVIDASESTWNMDLDNIENAEHWATLICVVHNLGNIVDVSALQTEYPKAIIVEDACEAIGGMYGVYPAGTKSFASAFSFYGNKNITAGEGGAFVTNDDEAFSIARRVWGQGQSDKKFIHSELGYNYRMTNIQAAILYGQLQDIDIILGKKAYLWHVYKEKLDGWVEFQKWESNSKHSLWMVGIRVPGKNYKITGQFFDRRGVEVRPMFYPINEHEHYKNIKGDMEVAEALSKECIILPSYPGLLATDQTHVIETVKEYVASI